MGDTATTTVILIKFEVERCLIDEIKLEEHSSEHKQSSRDEAEPSLLAGGVKTSNMQSGVLGEPKHWI
jgi:hypothetical protein